jgi:ATP-binding cassette subfamily B protein
VLSHTAPFQNSVFVDMIELSPGLSPAAFLFRAIRGRMLCPSALLCCFALGAQSLETLTAVALRGLVNSISDFVPGGTSVPYATMEAAALFIGCAAGAAALSVTSMKIEIGLRKRLVSSIERSLFAYSLWHAPRYFEDRLPGEISQQIRNAGQGASGLYWTFTYYGLRFVAMIVSAALVFSGSIPLLNVLALLWVIAYLAGSYYITIICNELSKQFAAKSGHVIGRMVDSLRNIGTVRSFGGQAFEQAYVGRHVDEERESHAALRRQFYRLVVFQITCKTVLHVLVIGFSLYALLEGRTDVGSVVMLITLAGLIVSLVQDISSRMYEVFDNFGKLSSALSYLIIPHAIGNASDAAPLSPADSSICFEHVTFRYPSGQFVIDDLNLCIRPQEKVGIVGVSGSGKSTILRLLKREYDPQAGRVLIGNADIRHCTLSSLTDFIAEVPQQVRLFNRSLRENIAYARPDASEDFIARASEAANCLDFISHRPDGFDAQIGEDGSQLSGGERQRVSIARAILKDAPILLLDEATSSLDASSEACVQRSLARLIQGKTVIAIAHRLSTLRQMDRIVVISDGRIIEEGSHAQLIGSGHHYRRLWEDQGVPRPAIAPNDAT